MIAHCINGPLPFDVAWLATWFVFGLVILINALVAAAAILRYVHFFHWDDLDEIEDR